MNNIALTIPPFPSQDLAKLVLGYLAEEQLMTAYDEFLQASPYLDAFRNEYDRIFMTSLKNILAEYRAVKIYVETCKPYILRRKLFQCPNLLEIVKFLVNNVDISKLHVQEANVEKTGQNRHSLLKTNVCDVCISLKLPNCVCKTSSQPTCQIEATFLENSVEATSLADLPGNTSSYKKKVAKLPENQSGVLPSISSSYQIKDNVAHSIQCQDHHCSTNDEKSSSSENINNISDPRHIVQDLNNVLNLVNHNRSDNVCKQDGYSNVENVIHKRIYSAGTSQDFSTAVDSSTINRVNVPDSSTSESNVLQSSSIDTDTVSDTINIHKGSTVPQILIRVGPDSKNMGKQLNTTSTTVHTSYTRVVSKDTLSKPTEEQSSPKITILSDIKVDDMKMPPVLRTATSTPLVKMQTLFINGMPAYKQQPKQNYTQDEIMAMPTIILVPATGASKDTVPTVTQNNMLHNNTNCTESVPCSSSNSLGPLVIDVTSPDPPSEQIENTNSNDAIQFIHKQNSDVSHMSLPKENILAGIKSSTPQVLPPKRKSSSTPRRTSHVRVLDFTTPRRILHETINEKSDQTECPIKQNVELPGAESIGAINNKINDETKTESNVDSSADTRKSTVKEKKTTIKLYNWDANLRALAYAGNGNIEKTETPDKPKSKKSKKKISPKGSNENITKVKKTSTKKVDNGKIDTPKSRNLKLKKKSSDISESMNATEEKVNISSVPVKPTINIISRNKRPDPAEAEKNLNKSSNAEEQIDTPELDKMSLQNEIGAKLNISDLLETPYKQVLYEMQMDTPKFLGPDIPDEPLSDIKIMNIPTPRFLNTPKLPQNTPSSYSSRPTDYSSGGSYYKPDDQDYVLATEVMECALSEDTTKIVKESTSGNMEAVTVEKAGEGKSRPVRKCTKNVSYNYSSNVVSSKIDTHDDKFDKSSTCSDNSMIKPVKLDKVKTPNPDKDTKKERKCESKKKSKKYKSPKKKETFMKIKPRRTTPVKEVSGKGRRKTSDTVHNVYIKSQTKKNMTGKEKNATFVPDIVPVSTKSRRKSSTPRKLHCTKIFNSESSGLDSPDRPNQDSTLNVALMTNLTVCCNQDSDTEPLRWSDEAPQSSEIKTHEDTLPGNDSDDISKIKEYISKPLPNETRKTYEGEGSLQVDLIKRGFDVETARKIELDLSGTNTNSVQQQLQTVLHVSQPLPSTTEPDVYEDKKSSDTAELNVSSSNNDKDEDESDEFDFSVHESNEDTNNYFSYKFDEATFVKTDQVKLKETFSMEICIEDDVAIRLRAMPFNTNFEEESKDRNVIAGFEKPIDRIETPHISDNLFTPRKAQCYEIFDSTLASLDTPLKSNSPRPEDSKTVTDIVLEVEKIETDTKKTDSKKRKRLQSDSSNGTKKSKTDTPYLLNSASIQNIDIESVLSKLHGP